MTAPDRSRTLAVVVVNFGTHALVEQNLLASTGPDFAGKVVVVDNLASEQDRAAMRDVCEVHGWTFVPSATNSGFGGGNNIGVEAARSLGCHEFLFLNPDARLDPAAIDRLHQRVLDDPMLLVAPLVMRPDGTVFSEEVDLYLDDGRMLTRSRRAPDTDPSRVHTWVSGACFLMGDRLWDASGGFDEQYFLYWEDVDLCHRVVAAGGTITLDRDAVAVHDEGRTHNFDGPRRAKSPIYYRYNTRNRLVYAASHLSAQDRRRWLRHTAAASYAIVLQGGRRQFLRPGRSLWPALRGTVEGLVAYRRILRRRGSA